MAVAQGATTGDFIRTLPALLESELPPDTTPPEGAEGAAAMALVTSLMMSFDCMLTYGAWLNQLVDRARRGDDRALFNAIRIDRSVICGPTGAARLSMAILRGETKFQDAVVRAWSQKLGVRGATNFRKIRLVLRVLVDAGAGSLTDSELYDLFVRALGLYTPDAGARKNLRKFVDGYMKEMSTT